MTEPFPEYAARRYPSPPAERIVCCHCKRPVVAHAFCRDGHWIRTWHCARHGDVVPVRSAVVNRAPAEPDWSAA